MDIAWIDSVAGGGLFGVIAALIYLLFARDKMIGELRVAISELSSAIAVLTELMRMNESYDNSAIGIARRIEEKSNATYKEVAAVSQSMTNLTNNMRRELDRCHRELAKDLLAELRK